MRAVLALLLAAAAGCASPGSPRSPAPPASAPAPAPPESPKLRRVLGRQAVLPYEGRFKESERFEVRVRELLALVPDAMDEVGARIGLGHLPVPPIYVRFMDTRSYREDGNQHWMRVHFERIGGVKTAIIEVRTDPFVGREYDLGEWLRHELVHCWHMSAIDKSREDVPSWIWEGLATWGTGQGKRLLVDHYVVGVMAWSSEFVSFLVNGLEEEHDGRDYAQSYLAFAMIEERWGQEAVRRFNRELVLDPDGARVVRRITGLELAEFYRQAREWSAARIRADIPDREEYVGIREAMDRREFSKALPALDAFLRKRPDSLFRALALAQRAQCRIEAGDVEGAQADLDASEREDRGGGELNDVRRWLRIALDAKRGRWKDVEREAGLFLFDGELTRGDFDPRIYVLFRMAQDEIRTGTHRK